MKPPIGRNALEALTAPPAAAPAPVAAPGAPAASYTRVNVLLGDQHLSAVEVVTRRVKRATRGTLDRSKVSRAMLEVLEAVADRLDYDSIRSEADLTSAVLTLLRPR